MQALLKPDEKAEELEAIKQALQINPVTGISDDYKNNLQSVLSYLDLMALGIFLDRPILPNYQQYIEYKLRKYSEAWLSDWRIQLWDRLFVTPEDMESLYYREWSPQKISELNYLAMRLTDTMQDIEVAVTKLRDEYQKASQEKFDDILQSFINEHGSSLKNIVTRIICRYFPEEGTEKITWQVKNTVLTIVR